MRLHHRVRPEIPALAWLLEIDGQPENHILHCGSGVTLGAAAFFEGTWAGDFTALDFPQAPETFGSGGALTSEGWVLVPPSNTLEALYICRDGEKLFASNSLAFLLAERADDLDPGYLKYHSDLFQILEGIDVSPIAIPSRKCSAIFCYYYHNLAVGPALEITVRKKPEAPKFESFEQYRDYLIAIVKAAIRNATDPERNTHYRPIATASQGYDSPTAAVIAQAAGCTEVITQGQARRAFGAVDSDSGEEIAKALGMQATVFDRKAYLQRSDVDCPEAEFICHGLEGMDVNFLAFEPVLNRRVLFTGYHGDVVWDKHKAPNTVIRRGDLTGASLGEFRLRVDFFHIVAPFIGVLRHPEIRAIANSGEMTPFSLLNDYDRPVPRRILEEAGVPRNAFGMAKKATNMMFFGLQIGLDDRFTKSTQQSLQAFAAHWHRPLGQRLRLLVNAALARSLDFTRLVLKKTRLPARLGIEKPVYRMLDTLDALTLDTPETVVALHWSMAQVKARYRPKE